MDIIKFIKLQAAVKPIAGRYFKSYEWAYRNNAISLEDLIQEGGIVLYGILEDGRYNSKPEAELKKIIITAVGRQFIKLHEKSDHQNENIAHIPNPTTHTENEISDEEFLESLSHEHSEIDVQEGLWGEIMGLCTKDEQDLLYKHFVECKTLADIGLEYDLTEGRISQKVKAVLFKLYKVLQKEWYE